MKIRQCFVANSSSSSFVCEICGASEVGYDEMPEGYVSCVNEHMFCDEHLLSGECNKDCDNCTNTSCINDYSRYEVPETLCPICQFVTYSEPDMCVYLKLKYKVDREDVFAIIKQANKRRKKLYNCEYITEVLTRNNVTDDQMVAEIKEKFKTYADYTDFLTGETKNENS